jgi:hypothetical protein
MRWNDRDIWLRLEVLVGLAAVVVLTVATFVSQFLK